MPTQNAGDAWTVFAHELHTWMLKRNVTDTALVNFLKDIPGVNESFTVHKVRKWKSSKPGQRSFPNLRLIVPITNFLRMSEDVHGDQPDSTYLLRRMGVLDSRFGSLDEAVNLAARVENLQTKLGELSRSAAAAGRSVGAANVVSAAIAGGQFSAAVFPAIEGPGSRGMSMNPLYRMHVADRIDLRRADGNRITRENVWANRDLRTALRASSAVEVLVPPLGATRYERIDEFDDVSHWSIAHIGSPSSAFVPIVHDGLRAVAISSTSPDSWASDIGSLLSLVLGYGYTSVRDLAREVYGNPTSTGRQRNFVHEAMLARRTPNRRVWSIYSDEAEPEWDGFPFLDRDGRVDPHLVHFRLSESDRLLDFHAERRGGDLSRLMAARDQASLAVGRAASTRVVELNIDLPDRPEYRSHWWSRTMTSLAGILGHLSGSGLLPELAGVHAELALLEPSIAPAVFTWLADHQAPGVDAAWSSNSNSRHIR